MLVYANHITCCGVGAKEIIFKAIGVWTKEQLGFGLRPDQLKEDGNFNGERDGAPSRLRVVATNEEKPELYAWILTNADSAVRGRQWTTELGLKLTQGNKLELSCIVKTDELSTRIMEPVNASCPRVIGYIASNILQAQEAEFDDSVAGLDVKTVGQDHDSYRGLYAEIERQDRNRPLVLVSPDRDGNYLIDTQRLQHTLFGLAQVVVVSSGFNSYDMAGVLGQQWSAWDGAVNILHIPSSTDFVYSKLLLSDQIKEWGDTQHIRISNLLSWVTNNTNAHLQRERIRPEGVMQLALRRRLQIVQNKSGQLDVTQLMKELAQASQRQEETDNYFDELADGNAELENRIIELNDLLDKKEYETWSLKEQLTAKGASQASSFDADRLLNLVCQNASPSPADCLNTIQSLYGDKCVILDSAKDSAINMNCFVEGRRLLDMLRRLADEYRSKLIIGGDNKARTVFGKNEYAAKESETVMKNTEWKRARIFDYNGKLVEMFRHLKIGVGDDRTKTIRVHFYWDSAKQLIVIGYCGEHLPVASH